MADDARRETLLLDGLPSSQWRLSESTTTESGAICVKYELTR